MKAKYLALSPQLVTLLPLKGCQVWLFASLERMRVLVQASAHLATSATFRMQDQRFAPMLVLQVHRTNS
jgi:hypothetical protein